MMDAGTGLPAVAFQTDGITKRFAGMTAVDEVDLSILQGEVHGIIGRNGAGKTVLVSMMAGVLAPSAGSLVIGGRRVGNGSYSPSIAHALGVTLIPQEPEFAPEMSVMDNLFLGAPVRRGPVLDHKKMRVIAQEALDAVGVGVDPRQRISTCSIEEQQLLALAKALFIEDARVILLDEITASLSVKRKDQLLGLLREEAAKNLRAFVLISHRVAEVMTVCDRVSVLRDGRRIDTVRTADTSDAELARMIVGGDLRAPTLDESTALGEEVVRVEGLAIPRACEDVSFALRRGEVLGVAGLDGSGKEELLNALYGLDKGQRGRIYLRGRARVVKSPKIARKLGVAYLPKKREELAVIHGMSVEDNVLLPIYSQLTRAGLINRRAARDLVNSRMQVLPVKTQSLRADVDSLSGGNRQRVMLNRMALLRPDLFILNEPTRGVDIASKPDIIATVRNDLRRKSGVILSSESEDELIDMCDRVIVLFRGKLVREFTRGDADFTSGTIYNSIQGVS